MGGTGEARPSEAETKRGETKRGDNEQANRWRARPVVAFTLRLVIVAVPLAAGYGAAKGSIALLMTQLAQSRWWLVVPAAVSLAVCLLLERVTRRLLPLAALLKLSMLFPGSRPKPVQDRPQGGVDQDAWRRSCEQPQAGTASSAAEAVLSLITALTAHDRRTRGHSERVRLFAELLGEQLRLPREARDRLRWASLLHDIGKLQVAVEILNKPSKLSATEFELIAQHPVTGEQLLGPLVEWLGEWGGAVRQHHEKYDGTGYPDGVAGAQICRAGRIVCIADSFEVMTAHRAYKKPMATTAARAELARCAGTQFDPAYVRAFLSISLPKLLWAMGPGSLLMNVALLRTAADIANKGAIASTAQGSIAAASAAAVIGGSAAAVIPVTGGAVVRSANPSSPRRRRSHLAAGRPRADDPTGAEPDTESDADPTPTPTSPVGADAHPHRRRPADAAPRPDRGRGRTAVAFTSVPAAVIATTTVDGRLRRRRDRGDVWCRLDNGAPPAAPAPRSATPDWPMARTPSPCGPKTEPGSRRVHQHDLHRRHPGADRQLDDRSGGADRNQHGDRRLQRRRPGRNALVLARRRGRRGLPSPISFTGLADGAHTITVYGVDPVGNVGASISTSFTVDTTGPTVTITSAPPATITSHTATVAFTIDDPASTTWCSLDGAAATTCTSPACSAGWPTARTPSRCTASTRSATPARR